VTATAAPLGQVDGRQSEIIYGHRVWRVMPYTALDGRETVRLCAVGLLGIPKVWNPLVPQHAVCSSHETHHEAPWYDCECGVWASNDAEWAYRRMILWMQSQGGDPVGWAVGRVAMWGRVIEHTKGWRAQYAYPYAVRVESEDEAVARQVRFEYAVDVEWSGPDLFRKVLQRKAEKAGDDDQPLHVPQFAAEALRITREGRKELAEIVAALTPAEPDDLAAKRSDWQRKHEQEQLEWAREDEQREKWAADNPLPPVEALTNADVMRALVAAAAIHEDQEQQFREKWRSDSWRIERDKEDRRLGRINYAPTFGLTQIVDTLLWLRGADGPGGNWSNASDGLGRREGRTAWDRAARIALKQAVADGLLEHGRRASDSASSRETLFYRPTKKGTGRAMAAVADGEVTWHKRELRNDDLRSFSTPVKLGLAALRRPQPMFAEEGKELVERWRAEARAAQRKSRKAFAAWLVEWRQDVDRRQFGCTLFNEDEVLRTLAYVCDIHGRAVSTAELMARLAPGEYSRGEVARVGQQLVKARKAKRVKTATAALSGKTVKVWKPAKAKP
jgi:hypothetical protein